jgi:hypothetical protein
VQATHEKKDGGSDFAKAAGASCLAGSSLPARCPSTRRRLTNVAPILRFSPRYGWALKGQRATGSVPRKRGKNTTLLASLGWDGMGESMIIEGAADTAAFEQYVESMLAPHLSAGQIVVMDNLRCQKSEKVRLATLRQRMPGTVLARLFA